MYKSLYLIKIDGIIVVFVQLNGNEMYIESGDVSKNFG